MKLKITSASLLIGGDARRTFARQYHDPSEDLTDTRSPPLGIKLAAGAAPW